MILFGYSLGMLMKITFMDYKWQVPLHIQQFGKKLVELQLDYLI